MSVVVLGSINMDIVVRSASVPAAGETVVGESFSFAPGGKGANQAVAASMAGADVGFVGRVGGDLFGNQLIKSLKASGIDTGNIAAMPDMVSGVAHIIITADSQNRIIVVPGANGEVDVSDVDRLKTALGKATLLLLQLEVPVKTNIAASCAAKAAGVRVVLDPAPAADLPEDLLANVDIITPNQSEAEAITGVKVENFDDAARAIKILTDMGISMPIIKMGAMGVCWMEEDNINYQAPFKVKVVDTVAAGDAFNGGLAAALDSSYSLHSAITFAQATAALCVTQPGAQQAMPKQKQIEQLVTANSSATADRL